MATNPFFRSNLFGHGEKALYESLIIEGHKMYGLDMPYIPRQYVALDKIYGEDKLSAFTKYYTLEFHIKSVNGYEGERDILSKFGLQIHDDVVFTCSQKRFSEEVCTFEPTIFRPREGDLIFFPLEKRIFEIKFCENMEHFYQAGMLFTYEIRCKTFELGGEQFSTGIDDIDSAVAKYAETVEVELTGVMGSFQVGETVYQGADEMTGNFSAQVVSFTPSPAKLVLTRTRGEMTSEENIIGATSSALGTFDDVQDDVLDNREDPIADNRTIYDESRVYLDTSEKNPLTG